MKKCRRHMPAALFVNSIPGRFLNQNDLDAIGHPLKSLNRITAANTGGAVAMFAFTGYGTRRFAGKPFGIGRSGKGFKSHLCFVQIPHNFVGPHHQNDTGRAVGNGCHTVGVSVHVEDFAAFRDGIGGGEIAIRAERAAENSLDLLAGQTRFIAIPKLIWPAAQKVQDAAFVQTDACAYCYCGVFCDQFF